MGLSMRNLRPSVLHLFPEKVSAVEWQWAPDDLPSSLSQNTLSAGGMWCSLQGHSQWCLAGVAEVSRRDFHSPWHPQQKCLISWAFLSRCVLLEIPAKYIWGHFMLATLWRGSCWCVAEERDWVGSLAVATLLWKIFHFQAHWSTQQYARAPCRRNAGRQMFVGFVSGVTRALTRVWIWSLGI